MSDLLHTVTAIAKQAGEAIMAVYARDFSVAQKEDNSPLTEADLASHRVIVAGLRALSDLPILSEESADIDWPTRQRWEQYWLVDPLDGTKEFIKKNGEFTVNIALIKDGDPVLGVVHAPALDITYVGETGQGAFKIQEQQRIPLHPATHAPGDIWKVVGSRSHQSPDIEAFLAQLPGQVELVAMGSSLKLCLVAEGKAHLYPRLGPTSEWDTAAAHAVVNAAGAEVVELQADLPWHAQMRPLRYNQKASVLNPHFLVRAR